MILLVETCLKAKIIQLPIISCLRQPQSLQIYKTNSSFVKIQLFLWNFINKLPFRKIFYSFTKRCKSCGRKYSEIYLEYYIYRKIKCKKCKFKAKTYSKIISIVLNFISFALKMQKNEFRRILHESKTLRRLTLSYMEGIGIYGLRIPQVPAGPIITLWSLTNRCNLNCTHCYIDQNQFVNEMSYHEVCLVIDKLYEAKNFVLGFSGGEALLRKDIFDIIKYASSKKMSIALASNGTLITPYIARKLKDSGAGYIQISIDGLQDIHDQIRGYGMFEKAIEGIENCLSAGLYVSMDVVVTKLNVHQIFDLIELAKSIGVQKFEILDFVPSENAADQAHLALTHLQMEKFGNIVCNIWHKLIKDNYPLTLSYKNPIFTRILAQRFPNVTAMPFFKGIFPRDALKFFNFSNRLIKGVFGEQTPFSPFITGCESGIYVIHIKPNGLVTPCPLNPVILGDVRKQHIQNIWQLSPILNVYRNLEFKGKCGKCVYKTMCGGCRAKVFLYTQMYNESDPTCFLNQC